MLKPNSIIGILGGGQLGRMTSIAAAELGFKVHVYTPEHDSPTEHICFKTTNADYLNAEVLQDFASEVDLVSFEFENIPYTTLEILEKHTKVFPSSHVIKTCQNRLREKDFVNSLGIKTAPYMAVRSKEDLSAALVKIGTPSVLKTTEMGYDGKGQVKLEDKNTSVELSKGVEYILEGFVNFTREISVIVARNEKGETACYEPVENIHKNHILDETIAPAIMTAEKAKQARNIAIKIADGLKLVGILAVEMFETAEGFLVNELAPRPHNSGHHTIDSCVTSQFEQFVRAISGLPLGSVKQHSKARMKNLIGDEVNEAQGYLTQPNAKLHLYGKRSPRPGRKMGHVNFIENA
jgi:5-(carboxyamino)imidazole ribonucleotide synthase